MEQFLLVFCSPMDVQSLIQWSYKLFFQKLNTNKYVVCLRNEGVTRNVPQMYYLQMLYFSAS